MNKYGWICGVLALVIFSACTPVPSHPSSSDGLNTPDSQADSFSTPRITQNPISGTQKTETLFPITEAPPILATSTPGAMQLFFPTVIAVEGAEYRPPLYPVPWALSPNDHFYFASPIAANYPGEPIWDYRYGGNFFGPDVYHTGIDLPAPRGTDVLAAGPGTVVWAGLGLFSGSSYNYNDPYGKAVAIRHDFGFQNQSLFTIYAHMDEIDVVLGQWLNTGDEIGKVGSTGNTTGPHLHFEVRLGANDFYQTRNPELWLVPPLGYGVLAGRVMNTFGQLMNLQKITITNVENEDKYQAFTYGPLLVNSDAYYNENVVMGDLPAGVYELSIPYYYATLTTEIQILPGQVSYFSFQGFIGYDPTLPIVVDKGNP